MARPSRAKAVLLVSNYRSDRTESMHIFARELRRGMKEKHVHIALCCPPKFVSSISAGDTVLSKWLGYIDKYIFFPLLLRMRACNFDLIHICDHSNSVYTSIVSGKRVVVTCHDLLAVRNANNDYCACPVGMLGGWLQYWIANGVRQSNHIVCVSSATQDSVAWNISRTNNACVIHNGVSTSYIRIIGDDLYKTLDKYNVECGKYILHVGSNLSRKSRKCLLRTIELLGCEENISLVIVGEPMNDDISLYAGKLNIENKVFEIAGASESDLAAIYSGALALVFPSRFEGFGWPPIEAQACGCPVVACDIPPVREILEDSAMLYSVDDERGIADCVQRLLYDDVLYRRMQESGYINVKKRFLTSRMIDQYISIYESMI